MAKNPTRNEVLHTLRQLNREKGRSVKREELARAMFAEPRSIGNRLCELRRNGLAECVGRMTWWAE